MQRHWKKAYYLIFEYFRGKLTFNMNVNSQQKGREAHEKKWRILSQVLGQESVFLQRKRFDGAKGFSRLRCAFAYKLCVPFWEASHRTCLPFWDIRHILFEIFVSLLFGIFVSVLFWVVPDSFFGWDLIPLLDGPDTFFGFPQPEKDFPFPSALFYCSQPSHAPFPDFPRPKWRFRILPPSFTILDKLQSVPTARLLASLRAYLRHDFSLLGAAPPDPCPPTNVHSLHWVKNIHIEVEKSANINVEVLTSTLKS